MQDSGHVIGIDLGTTNSVVAVCEAGEMRVIANHEGQNKTPSVVAFGADGSVSVGEIARRQAATQPLRTISSAKRLMGRLLNEVIEQEEEYPFELSEDDAGRVLMRVNGGDIRPEEVSAEILKKLKLAAEDYLGGAVQRAVITVPAYFDDLQRQATHEAARLAGLEVLRLLNEPTAAAMAYGLGKEGHHTVAVYDFGGGTFDFSVMEIDNKTFEVLVSTGDSRLGGDDLDQAVVDWLADEFGRKHNVELRDDMMALRRLKEAAEQAKCELSTAFSTRISLPFIIQHEGQPLHLDEGLSREFLEELTEPLIQRTLGCCQKALRDAKLRKEDLSRIILVGGSTRMPLVQDLVEDFFGVAPFKGLNPDEVVATGAAAQGAVMNGELDEVVLLEVTPHCLGLEVKGGRKSTLVEKNSTIPLKVFKTFTTTEAEQNFVNIHVLQGDGERAADCRSVGKFTLSGITAASAGVPRIKVEFFVNADGIIEISATDLQSGQAKSLTINHAYLSSSERQQQHQQQPARRRRRRRTFAAGATGPGRSKGAMAQAAPAPAIEDVQPIEPVTQSAAPMVNDPHGQFDVLNPDADSKPGASPAAPAPAAPAPPRTPKIITHPIATPARAAQTGRSNTLPGRKTELAPWTRRAGLTAAHSEIAETMVRSDNTGVYTPTTPNATPAPQHAAVAVAAAPAAAGVAMPDCPPTIAAVLGKLQHGCETDESRGECLANRDAVLKYFSQHAAETALKLLLARFQIAIQQPEEARETILSVVQHEPALAAQCLEAFNSLVRNFPNYHAARKERGQLAAALERWETAIADFEFVVERDEKDTLALEQLRDIYKRVAGERNDATLQFKLVKLHLRTRELDAAIGLLQQLVALPDYRDRANKVLGLCFWQKGMRYLAWQKFRALPLDEEMKDILYRLATDMETYDELLHAKYALERVYEVDIHFRDVAERLKKLVYRLELQKDERFSGGAPQPMTPFQDSGEFGKRFEVLGEINRGSMGIVYKARDLILDEIVAIKVLNEYLCSDPQAVERFKQEARSARKLTHQNIVRIHDMFDLAGKKIISMEYIEGENLKTLLARNLTFSEDYVLNLLVQICEGLAYAHRVKLVHRDIKPANIMLTDRGQVKITDFGIAKILNNIGTKSQTMVMGTPLYMAPEQIEGINIDHRCDIYALGIMLYELLTGNPPFCEGNIEYHHIHSPAPEIRVGISDKLKAITMKCIEKKADHRFQTVEEILARII